MFSSHSHLLKECSIMQKKASISIPTVLSHWLQAAHSKHGLSTNIGGFRRAAAGLLVMLLGAERVNFHGHQSLLHSADLLHCACLGSSFSMVTITSLLWADLERGGQWDRLHVLLLQLALKLKLELILSPLLFILYYIYPQLTPQLAQLI